MPAANMFARRRRRLDAVGKGKEGVRGHDGTLDLELCILGLDKRDTRTVDPAHLSGADSNGALVLCINNGIGFHVFHYRPGK